jgi:hypothetical protein
MRAFKRYLFNLAAHCRFSQTYGEVEAFLENSGLLYDNALFFCESLEMDTPPATGRMVERFPELQPYFWVEEGHIRSLVVANCDRFWRPADDRDLRAVARVLSTKIPRPYALYFAGFVISGVSFFGPAAPQIVSPEIKVSFEMPLRSHISFWKHFGSGIKYNHAMLSIEVTDDAKGLAIRDDSAYLRAFTGHFGCAPESTGMIVSAPEWQPGPAAREALRQIVAEGKAGFEAWDGTDEVFSYTGQDQFRPSQYSFRQSIRAAGVKKHGYDYYRYDNGCYYLRRIDSLGNAIDLMITCAPICRRIDTFVEYRGAVFMYRFKVPSFVPETQAEADRYMKALLSVLDNAERKHFGRIAAHYPKTPEWYIY